MAEPNFYAAPEFGMNGSDGGAESMELADRGTRLGANILDGIIIIVVFAAIGVGLWLVWGDFVINQNGFFEKLVFGVCSALLGNVIYFSLNGYLLMKYGQTIGKRACDIKIVKPDGSTPSLVDSFVKRYFLVLLIQAVPMIGGLFSIVDALMIFRDSRKCLHDEIADTLVVKA